MREQLLDFKFGFSQQLPLILQTEAAECGLACLGMIAGYYGHQIDLVTLRTRFSLSSRGVTLANLIKIGESMHLSSRAIRADEKTVANARLPCILHWNLNHFVVLKSVKVSLTGKISSYRVHDPALGEIILSPEEFSASFTGVVLELAPTPLFQEKREQSGIDLWKLLGSAVGLRQSMAQVLILALVIEIFTLLSPFLMQLVVDSAIFSSDRDMLITLIAGFGLLMLVNQAIITLRSFVILHMSSHLNFQWISNVFEHLLNLPLSFFAKRQLGDIASRFASVTQIEQTLSTRSVETVLDGIFSILVLVIMLIFSPLLTFIVLGFMLVYVILRVITYSTYRRANAQKLYLQAKESDVFFESVNGIQTIKLFNHETARRGRWLNAVVAKMNRGISTKRMEIGFETVERILKGGENLTVLLVAALLVMNGQFTLGMMVSFIAYKTLLVSRLYSFSESIFEIKMLSLQADRVADIVLTAPEAPEDAIAESVALQMSQSSGPTPGTAGSIKSIEIRNLSFRYADGEPWIIHNLSLDVRMGESVAIVGASGCGKTTLLKLMVGILIPSEGEIRINGIPLNQFGARRFRNLIGVVMQDDQLFAGTLTDNISFFDSTTDHVRVIESAVMASIAQDIENMPMRFQTMIIGAGGSLSGGQKQRVLLARAIYKRPEILFLDEATSHLDGPTECAVNRNLQNLPITKIVIAHRDETIRAAQRVICLDKGAIVSDVTQQLEARV